MYYLAIKNTDLDSDSLDKAMSLLYESNRDSLVSIAAYTLTGEENPSQYTALEKGKYAWLDYSRVTSGNLEDFSD